MSLLLPQPTVVGREVCARLREGVYYRRTDRYCHILWGYHRGGCCKNVDGIRYRWSVGSSVGKHTRGRHCIHRRVWEGRSFDAVVAVC